MTAPGMTVTEKIIARKAHRERVAPGDYVMVDVDLACVDDVQFHIFADRFEALDRAIWDKERVVLMADHYLPPSGVDEAEVVRGLAEFGRRHGLPTYTRDGVKHQVFIERGLVKPGDVLVATDSHTNTGGAVGAFALALGPTDLAAAFVLGKVWLRVSPTIRLEVDGGLDPSVTAMDVGLSLLGKYGRRFANDKTIEWAGSALAGADLPWRMTLCNLTTEFGAASGIFEVADANGLDLVSDPDAGYETVLRHAADEFQPVVAAPPNPANVQPAAELAGTRIDQAYLGSCTHGTLHDLRVAAEFLDGRRVHGDVRLLVTPATQRVYTEALREGILATLVDAGATICSPGCGSCPGMHEGTLGEGEVRISTQNRNFIGRSGHVGSHVYLASPLTVAAAAIAGEIVDPRELAS